MVFREDTSPIVLSTLNAKYTHASFGLRYIYANLGDLRSDSRLLEFTIKQRVSDIVEEILSYEPKILGLGVYIWNADESYELVRLIKRLDPSVVIVIGGPEVSYETESQLICQSADYVIKGEGEKLFRKLCQELMRGKRPLLKQIGPQEEPLSDIHSPYAFYNAEDIANRVIYVEASRGCPFRCEFCLSALDKQVRTFDLKCFLEALQDLVNRGVRHFKFVDRTFNLNIKVSQKILEFFLEPDKKNVFVHFELIPDRLPEALREVIIRFAPGRLQFEIGIQTFCPLVAQRISRRQHIEQSVKNLRYLKEHTGVHLHTDLIVGLPGETLASFAQGFDRLVGLEPDEIQVGILKRLRGAPIIRHEEEFEMVFSPKPPYDILKNKQLDFPTLQRLKRFAAVWDTMYNSGNFKHTCPRLWRDKSPFWGFLRFSDWLYEQAGRTHSIALDKWFEWVRDYRVEVLQENTQEVTEELAIEYQRPGRVRLPKCLRYPYQRNQSAHDSKQGKTTHTPIRQARHLA
jgi:radical SAM superfamily enzyme YgiQ (UPF0313 family)